MKVEPKKLMTPSAFAKLKGVSAATITNGMNSGLIPFVEITGGRLVLFNDDAKRYIPKRDKRRQNE